jgi:hypothetical protein
VLYYNCSKRERPKAKKSGTPLKRDIISLTKEEKSKSPNLKKEIQKTS